MAVQQRQQRFAPTQSGGAGKEWSSRSASAARWQQRKWQQEQEREWEGHLRCLHQCICEVLVKNQQLRESLRSTTNHP